MQNITFFGPSSSNQMLRLSEAKGKLAVIQRTKAPGLADGCRRASSIAKSPCVSRGHCLSLDPEGPAHAVGDAARPTVDVGRPPVAKIVDGKLSHRTHHSYRGGRAVAALALTRDRSDIRLTRVRATTVRHRQEPDVHQSGADRCLGWNALSNLVPPPTRLASRS